MHTETISNSLWGLLEELNKITDVELTYLGGGTGLALQIGHRKSEDLDFYVDLYCITRKLISLESLISLCMEENHGIQYNKLLFLKGLIDFEEADREPDPLMIHEMDWERVKETLTKEVMQIAERLL